MKTVTDLNDEHYSELPLSAGTTHNNSFKQDSKFVPEYQWSVYELKKLPNDNDEASCDIDFCVDIIQA